MPILNTKTALFLVLLFLLAAPGMAALQPGRITVSSSPTGAHACVNTDQCDLTTATFTVPGNAWYTVNVTEAGYQQWSEKVFVTTEQISQVDAYLDLDPDATAIHVYSTPGGGTVCLDNSDCQVTVGTNRSTNVTQSGSALFTKVSPGYHTITVGSPAGYQDTSELVQVTLGKISTVNIALNPDITPLSDINTKTGSIRVYVDHTGSTICIDNGDCFINVGGSPGTGTGTAIFNEVTADEVHILTVALNGYKPVSAKVTVGADQVATADVSMHPLGTETTVPVSTTVLSSTVPSAIPTRNAGLDALPVIGALALCGAIVLIRKIDE
jgi:hypothetical protein